MTDLINGDQPIGAPVPGWTARPRPDFTSLDGRTCFIERLDAAAHGDALWSAYAADAEGRIWTYLPNGPFAERAAFDELLGRIEQSADPLFFTIRMKDARGVAGAPVGFYSLLRIDPANGSIELGFITFSPALQRTVAASESMILMIRWAFEAGYRRFEWKCNALNAPSRRAAERLGLSYEGVFRQAQVVKGRNRDTAWFAAIDADYPALEAAYAAWLAPENFDAEGRQRQSLAALTRPLLKSRDPSLVEA